MIAIDTNIFLYIYDADEPLKQQKAKDFIDDITRTNMLIMPWQVVVEFLFNLRRWVNKGKITPLELNANYSVFRSMGTLTLPIPAIIDRSLDLYSRYSLSHWDSLLVAACLEAGVTTLYSEDMDHGAYYDTLQVINPFKLPSANQP